MGAKDERENESMYVHVQEDIFDMADVMLSAPTLDGLTAVEHGCLTYFMDVHVCRGTHHPRMTGT